MAILPLFVRCLLLCGCIAACTVRSEKITRTAAFPKIIEQAKKENRYLIMRSGVDTFAITAVQVEKAKRQFTVHLSKPDSLHQMAISGSAMQQPSLHLFMRDSTSYTLDEPHTIPVNRIARMEWVH